MALGKIKLKKLPQVLEEVTKKITQAQRTYYI